MSDHYDQREALFKAEQALDQKYKRGEPMQPKRLEIKHTDSETLYFVGALTRIANAARREDGSDIPLGETLREACKHMEAQAQEIGELHARIDGMTPPAPWSDRK